MLSFFSKTLFDPNPCIPSRHHTRLLFPLPSHLHNHPSSDRARCWFQSPLSEPPCALPFSRWTAGLAGSFRPWWPPPVPDDTFKLIFIRPSSSTSQPDFFAYLWRCLGFDWWVLPLVSWWSWRSEISSLPLRYATISGCISSSSHSYLHSLKRHVHLVHMSSKTTSMTPTPPPDRLDLQIHRQICLISNYTTDFAASTRLAATPSPPERKLLRRICSMSNYTTDYAASTRLAATPSPPERKLRRRICSMSNSTTGSVRASSVSVVTNSSGGNSSKKRDITGLRLEGPVGMKTSVYASCLYIAWCSWLFICESFSFPFPSTPYFLPDRFDLFFHSFVPFACYGPSNTLPLCCYWPQIRRDGWISWILQQYFANIWTISMSFLFGLHTDFFRIYGLIPFPTLMMIQFNCLLLGDLFWVIGFFLQYLLPSFCLCYTYQVDCRIHPAWCPRFKVNFFIICLSKLNLFRWILVGFFSVFPYMLFSSTEMLSLSCTSIIMSSSIFSLLGVYSSSQIYGTHLILPVY